jgi:mannose-6-phosphate isomerase-like protein (cupin superfamily)
MLCLTGFGQKDSARGPVTDYHGDLINDVQPDTWQSLDTVKAPAAYENIYSRTLHSDSLVSSFVIFVKNEVKEHRHANHAEHVMVLDGEAIMKVGPRSFKIKKGDLVFIPKNSWHNVKVTSKKPLKVLSIQAPNFDGKDRILKESK